MGYLKSKRGTPSNDLVASNIGYYPSEKQTFFVDSTLHIPLRTMREDLKLRSTFFAVQSDGENVIFTGQGFGHGVGLCQEGGMRMAQLGKTYQEIIHFYYKDVHLVPRSMMWFFKE
jgi:stage II sporulation protein D